jgi:hypothetical protein
MAQRKFPVHSPVPSTANSYIVNYLTFVVNFLLTNVVLSVAMEVQTNSPETFSNIRSPKNKMTGSRLAAGFVTPAWCAPRI